VRPSRCPGSVYARAVEGGCQKKTRPTRGFVFAGGKAREFVVQSDVRHIAWWRKVVSRALLKRGEPPEVCQSSEGSRTTAEGHRAQCRFKTTIFSNGCQETRLCLWGTFAGEKRTPGLPSPQTPFPRVGGVPVTTRRSRQGHRLKRSTQIRVPPVGGFRGNGAVVDLPIRATSASRHHARHRRGD